MPRNPPTERISASTWLFLIAKSAISPTDWSFWLWTLRPFSFELRISSFGTVENLASAGAVPVVLASSANAGLASKATDTAIMVRVFMTSSMAELLLYNARREPKFQDFLENNAQEAARRASSSSRASSDFAVSDGSRVARVTAGSD